MPAINDMLRLIIFLVLAGVVIYLVYWILGMVTMPQPVKTAILIVLGLLILLWLLNLFAPGLLTSLPVATSAYL